MAEEKQEEQKTSPGSLRRTLLDLAGTLHHAELRKAVAEAEVLGLVDREALDQLVKRSRGRRGVARLRQLVSSLDPQTARTRTELERRFLKLCHQAGLTSPEVNSRLDLGRERIEPDFLWRDARLIVETDGRRFHDTATAFERDRRRDQLLAAAGWRVVRFTWGQVTREPSRVARTVEALLTQATRRPAGRNRSDSDRNRPVGG